MPVISFLLCQSLPYKFNKINGLYESINTVIHWPVKNQDPSSFLFQKTVCTGNIMSVSKKLGQSAVVYTTVLCPSFFETDVSLRSTASWTPKYDSYVVVVWNAQIDDYINSWILGS